MISHFIDKFHECALRITYLLQVTLFDVVV